MKKLSLEKYMLREDFDYIDNPKYINGFYKYVWENPDDIEASAEVKQDVVRFIDLGYYVILGEDWKKQWLVYGYDGESFFVVELKSKSESCERQETLKMLLENSGFFEGNRQDMYLRIRPVKCNLYEKKKWSVFRFGKRKC